MNKKVLLSLVVASSIGATGMYAAQSPVQASAGAQEAADDEEAVDPNEAQIEAAYEADSMRLQNLLSTYNEVVEEISSNYSEYEDEETESQLLVKINKLWMDCMNAHEDAYESGSYDFSFTDEDADAIMMEIMQMYYCASNQAVFAALEEQALGLQKDLDAADREILEKYGQDVYEDPAVRELYVAASDRIQSIYVDIQDAYDLAQENGDPFVYQLSEANTADVDVAISKMQAKAKEIADQIEAERVAYNDAAYGDDMTWLSSMQEALSAKWEEIGKSYPYYYTSEEGEAYHEGIYGKLLDMYDSVEAQYEVVAEKGSYVSPITPVFRQDIEDDIAGMQYDANTFNYKKVVADIDALDKDLQDATSTDQPYYDQLDRGLQKSISNQIEALADKAKSAYENDKYEGVFNPDYTAEINSIKASINTLIKNAEEAYREVANEEAYNTLKGELDDLEKALDKAVNGHDYSYLVNGDKVMAVRAEIDILREDADKAYAAVEKEGNFSMDISEEIADLYDQIDAIVAAAEKALFNTENASAYGKVIDAIDALQEYFDNMTSDKQDYYDYISIPQMNALQKLIDTIREEAEDAYAQGGKFEYDPSDQISKAKSAIKDMCDAAFEKYNEERIDDNNKAAMNDKRQLNVVREYFELAIAALDEQIPGWYEDEAYAEYENKRADIDLELNDVETEINAALEDVKEEGIYESPMTDVAWQDLQDEIDELVYGVEMTQANGDRAEYNENAFQVDEDMLIGLSKRLDNVWSEILEENPEFAHENVDRYSEIFDTISNLYDAAMEQAENCEESGWYVSVVEDYVDQINAAINALAADAGVTGVASMGADTDAEYFTLDGQKLSQPVKGQVNIVRRGNKVSKTFVK